MCGAAVITLGAAGSSGQTVAPEATTDCALVRELVANAADAGQVRDDIGADELAGYAINALNAAAALPSEAAVDRLVQLTTAGLGCPQKR